MLADTELKDPIFHATRRLYVLWNVYINDIENTCFEELEPLRTNAEIQKFMQKYNLFDYHTRPKVVTDKQIVVDEIKKQVKDSNVYYHKLIANARRSSFRRRKKANGDLYERLNECIDEFLEVREFKRWVLEEKENEWNDILNLCNRFTPSTAS
jgi:hypothetical protein